MKPRSFLLFSAVFIAVAAHGQAGDAVARPPVAAPSLDQLAQMDKKGQWGPQTFATIPEAPASKAVAAVEPAPPVKKLVSGTGSLSFQWKNVPLNNAIRVLARYLNKPVNVGVARTVIVSGDYKELAAEDILQDIAEKAGLQLNETEALYTVRDGAGPLALPVARVVFKAPSLPAWDKASHSAPAP